MIIFHEKNNKNLEPYHFINRTSSQKCLFWKNADEGTCSDDSMFRQQYRTCEPKFKPRYRSYEKPYCEGEWLKLIPCGVCTRKTEDNFLYNEDYAVNSLYDDEKEYSYSDLSSSSSLELSSYSYQTGSYEYTVSDYQNYLRKRRSTEELTMEICSCKLAPIVTPEISIVQKMYTTSLPEQTTPTMKIVTPKIKIVQKILTEKTTPRMETVTSEFEKKYSKIVKGKSPKIHLRSMSDQTTPTMKISSAKPKNLPKFTSDGIAICNANLNWRDSTGKSCDDIYRFHQCNMFTARFYANSWNIRKKFSKIDQFENENFTAIHCRQCGCKGSETENTKKFFFQFRQ